MLSAINARVEGSMLGIVLPEETSPNLQDLADGVTAKVTVLVQPGSDQACLVGMNAILKLGIRLLHSNGIPVCAEVDQVATRPVRLVQTCTLPGRKGRFLDVAMDGGFEEGTGVLFEPDNRVLGLSSSEDLLTAGPGGKLFRIIDTARLRWRNN